MASFDDDLHEIAVELIVSIVVEFQEFETLEVPFGSWLEILQIFQQLLDLVPFEVLVAIEVLMLEILS